MNFINRHLENSYAQPKKKSAAAPDEQWLDPSFGQAGVAYQFSAGSDPLQIVSRRPDEKLLLAGGVYWEGHQDFQLVQLLEDGSRDPDFADDGILKGGFKVGSRASLHGAQLYKDGKILVIGTHRDDIEYLAFARFLENGKPDYTFGDGGLVLNPYPTHLSNLAVSTRPHRSMTQPTSNTAIGPNGEIIMAGWMSIFRYDPDGKLDLSFNGSGSINVDFVIHAVGASADGAITVVGSSSVGFSPQNEGIVARFKADGTPDNSFGTSGITRIRIDEADTVFSGLLLREDGSTFVTGSLDRTPNDVWGNGRRGVLAAFNGNGWPNLVFNGGKAVVSELPSSAANAWSDIGGDPAHGIVVVGLSGARSRESTLIARYEATGKLDITFGDEGFLNTRFGKDYEFWKSVVVQPDQKIIASGDCRYFFDRATVARFLANRE